MHTSDLFAQVASILVGAISMLAAWLITRRYHHAPRPVPPAAPDITPKPGAGTERPI